MQFTTGHALDLSDASRPYPSLCRIPVEVSIPYMESRLYSEDGLHILIIPSRTGEAHDI